MMRRIGDAGVWRWEEDGRVHEPPDDMSGATSKHSLPCIPRQSILNHFICTNAELHDSLLPVKYFSSSCKGKKFHLKAFRAPPKIPISSSDIQAYELCGIYSLAGIDLFAKQNTKYCFSHLGRVVSHELTYSPTSSLSRQPDF